MATFLTVDRLGGLREGMQLDVVRHTDIDPAELQQHVDALFPQGVSRHGDFFLLSSGTLAGVASPRIELLFEYVRRARFPERPSRFMSYFGAESMDAAQGFNARFGQNKGAIWEVEASNWFRANMNLLTSNQTNLVFSYFAELYWCGTAGPIETFWAVLLVPPVRVLRKVADAAA